MSLSLNTIDRCFFDAHEILKASKNGSGGIAKTYAIFTDLQPILAASQEDSRLALLALAIWRVRQQTNHEHTAEHRRGVIHMKKKPEDLQVRAGSRTYFFDLKETKDKKPFLVITESRFKGEGKDHERTSMVIFQEHMQEFSNAVSTVATQISKLKSK